MSKKITPPATLVTKEMVHAAQGMFYAEYRKVMPYMLVRRMIEAALDVKAIEDSEMFRTPEGYDDGPDGVER